jgi:hypothetical protein
VDYADWKTRLKRDPWKTLAETRQSITLAMLEQFKIAA